MSQIGDREVFDSLFFPTPTPVEAFTDLQDDLDAVFGSKSLGFRELLATVVYGKCLNCSYDPKQSLYACHPRSLYEQDMRPVLIERGVPCGQSGPLNIAKATKALDNQWAAQRRPRPHADAVLRLVAEAMKFSSSELQDFAAELGRRFDEDALAVVLSQNDLAPVESSVILARIARELIVKHPLGGTSPQMLCGIALETEFRHEPEVTVNGARDSASTTNRTSKKIGDLSVERASRLQSIFEVTVKSFSSQRISEAVQSIRAFHGDQVPPPLVVQVLCRRQDIPSTVTPSGGGGHLGEFVTDGIIFEFIDVFEWLSFKIAGFSLEDRAYFYEQVQDFLNTPRVPTLVRRWWAEALDTE